MKKLIFFVDLWLIVFLFSSAIFSQTHFTATLTGDQENPAVTTSATGTGSFTLTDTGLEFSVTVEGLTFTAAHFHNGAIGVDGGVVRPITDDFTGNTASGIWTSTDPDPLTPELIADLLAGNLYLNIHTTANPGGELRGQVNLSAGTGFNSNLDGDQENPPVITNAMGTSSLTLTDAGLEFSVTVEGLTFTAAHFHNGAVGVNGGVVRTITDDFVGNTASGLWTSTDAEPLTPALIAELLAGNIYFNIHNAANPGGEIRGQVFQSTETGFAAFTANLTGDQENPGVTTSATGTGVFKLSDAGLEFSVTVEGLTFTAAHFHNGAIGVDGGVVRPITDDFTGNTASGIWTSTDPDPLTPELIADLLAGNLYLNIHTTANPGGELRGQVNLSAGTGFNSNLDGDQENPPVITNAMGTSSLTLTDAGLEFSVTVEGLTFTAAHFHNGAVGVNGGVVRTITDDFVGNTATGLWTSTDAEPLTPELIAELLAGNIYFNIHNAANPGGEIRGQVNLATTITSVELVDETAGIPEEFNLYQNYPNPFNPTTTIRFELKESGQTVLKIYDLLGKEVFRLVDEELPAGSYKVTFDANFLPSGIYFYRLESSGFNKVRKMILLR